MEFPVHKVSNSVSIASVIVELNPLLYVHVLGVNLKFAPSFAHDTFEVI